MRVEVDGIGVSVEILGQGPSKVLFVHGLGASRTCWDEASRFFDPTRHTLVLPDLPGCGRSDKPEDHDYSMESMASALEGVLSSLGFDAVHVVAHSMGCAVALLLAKAGRVTLQSFVSAEGNLVPEDAFMSSKVARLKEPTFARVFSKWLKMVEDSLGPEPVRLHEVFLESLRACPPVALHRTSVSCLELTRSGDLARHFAALRCPRLYVIGGRTLEERGLPAPAEAEDVEVLTIPGAGHFMMDDAEAFYPPVRQFVEGAQS